jgi:hypothetical protein
MKQGTPRDQRTRTNTLSIGRSTMLNVHDTAHRNSHQRIISRSTIAILAGLLVAAGWGQQLPAELAQLCNGAGFFGLAAYAALTLVAEYRSDHKQVTAQLAIERRLNRRVRTERPRINDRSRVSWAGAARSGWSY